MAALGDKDFGVLTTIGVRATMKKKLDVDTLQATDAVRPDWGAPSTLYRDLCRRPVDVDDPVSADPRGLAW